MTDERRNQIINGTLDRLERVGRIMSVYGNTVMLILFIGFFTGWLPSPLLRTTEGIALTLKDHNEKVADVVRSRTTADQRLAEALSTHADQIRRQTNLLKMVACVSIREADIRAACLKE